MIQWRPVYVICLREFKKFFREKSASSATLARPVLWLFVVGNGMNSLIRPQAGFSYLQFIFPGMIGMTSSSHRSSRPSRSSGTGNSGSLKEMP